MTTPLLYGIKNCDTVKKARAWLNERSVSYHFVDFRSDGINVAQVSQWIDTIGLEQLLNKRSTTWKNLSEAERQQALSPKQAGALIVANPTLIKRPLLETGKHTTTGFKPADYAALFTR
ncbi:MAG TPA: ArsC family reductase [Cellvibrionaceae bacterium]